MHQRSANISHTNTEKRIIKKIWRGIWQRIWEWCSRCISQSKGSNLWCIDGQTREMGVFDENIEEKIKEEMEVALSLNPNQKALNLKACLSKLYISMKTTSTKHLQSMKTLALSFALLMTCGNVYAEIVAPRKSCEGTQFQLRLVLMKIWSHQMQRSKKSYTWTRKPMGKSN